MHNMSIRVMLEGLLGTGETTLYGRQYPCERLRQAGMPVVHDRMFAILKELDLIGVADRRLHLGTRPPGAYTVPGPNFV